MRSGRLKHRITFQKKTTIATSFGDMQETWNNVATISADVLVISGKEAFEEHQMTAELSYKIRYRPRQDLNITASDRIIWQNRTLEIIHTPYDPYGRGDEMNTIAKEINND